ncbi:hypothetical protein [Fodinicola feengrottensis]|uniref:hypothetical protein n=1 Tax=Fodinicola feengrottensis TaxID=435914 RepID=UPI0013D6EF1C|nr:hypothetical protein [Fodinicola feengrottensis]
MTRKIGNVRRAAVVVLALVGLLVPMAMTAGAASAAAQTPFDPKVVPGSQVVYVSAPKGSSHATMSLWQRDRDGWAQTLSVPARVGPPGISKDASEYVSYTPEGMFTLTEAFGRQHNPGSGLPYRYVGTSDRWWVGVGREQQVLQRAVLLRRRPMSL